MREYKDFEEKNVDKAIEKACSELGLRQEELEYDIISHGSSGIFGLVGAKKAVIRVAIPGSMAGSTLPSMEDTGETSDSRAVSALVDEAFGPVQETSTDSALPAVDAESRSRAVDWVRGFIGRIIELVSPDSTVSVDDTGEPVRIEIQGGDSARLIGKRGQTLDAIHYLVEKAVYKQFGLSMPIEIDVEGYLEKRRSELTDLAYRLAEKARQTGKPMVINRISAQDRRLVHLTLRDNREVRTQSVGNGDLRKLLIMPKKKAQARRTRNKKE